MMKKLLLIVNPYAGQRRANRYLSDILEIFRKNDYRCEVFITGASGEAARYAAQYGGEFDRVICAGGDGTLNETIDGLMSAALSVPLGYIPCGTTNDFAFSIGLSADIPKAAQDAVTGRITPFDIGTFNGRHFTYTATCGAFARTSYTTPQAAKNLLGHAAYVLNGAMDLASIKPMRLRVETEEYHLEDDFIFCSLTNSTSVGGILQMDEQLISLNDGKFEVTLVRNPVNPAQMGTILSSLTTMDIPNEMIHFFSTSKLKVHCDEPVEWTLDGERGPETTDAELQNHHAAIRMIVPQHAMNDLPLSAEGGEDDQPI